MSAQTGARCGPYDLTFLPDPVVTGDIIEPSSDVLIAKTLLYSLHIARSKADDLYVYKNGVYKAVGQDLKSTIIDICELFKKHIKWSPRIANNVIEYLTSKVPMLDEVPNPNIVNMRNGFYYVNEERFESHEDQYRHWENLSTAQLPINYDPLATCDRVDKFLDDIFPGGKDLLFDVIGLCLTSNTNQHKAIVLLGDGSNGKSLFLYGLRAMVGRENYSATELRELGDPHNKFANNDLVGKLVNGSDDTAQGKLVETSNIKSIISGNPIRVEGKFKTPYFYRPYCKMVFATNHRLSSDDETSGYMRRFMHIPFSQRFGQDPAKHSELEKMWDDEGERSGVFNEIAKRIRVTAIGGLQIPDEVRHLVETFDPIPESVKRWLEKDVISDPEGKIPMDRMKATFVFKTRVISSSEQISRYINALFSGVKVTRARGEDGRKKYYVGIKWANPEIEEYAMNSHIGKHEEMDTVEEVG